MYRTLAPGRAYWRTAPFAEMAQLYAARFLRIIAQNLIGAFVSVFLYQRGYPIELILLIVGGYYVSRVIMSFISAYVVAWFGPKHSLLFSNLLAVPALVALAMIEQYTVWAVGAYFLFESMALSLLAVASDTHFSSIKTDHKAGKELGWMYSIEKLGSGLAPFAGGLLAYQFGPESVMWLSAVVMVASALPLFGTPERVRNRQRIIFQGLPWREVRQQYIARMMMGADQATTATVWSLFIVVAILGVESNRVYAELGVFFSISFIVSLLISRVYGSLVDKNKGDQLHRFGIGLNALLHLTRPAVSTPVGIGMANAMNEAATIAYAMPYTRGQYHVADNLPGYRVVYFSASMIAFCSGAAIMSFIAAGAVVLFGPINGMRLIFILMAFACIPMLRHGFVSLRVRK